MKKAITLTLTLAMALCLLAGAAGAQGQKDVLKALIVMEEKCKAGVRTKDYPAALAELAAEVRIYLGTPEAQKTPQFNQAAQEALEAYQDLGRFLSAGVGAIVSRLDPEEYAYFSARYPGAVITDVPGGRIITQDIAPILLAQATQATARARQSVGR